MDKSRFSAISYRRAYFLIFTSVTTVEVFALDGLRVVATFSSLKTLMDGMTSDTQLYKKKKIKRERRQR